MLYCLVGRVVDCLVRLPNKGSWHGVWNCVQDMAIGSPLITWDFNTKWCKVGVHCIAALHAIMCTSAYPSED
ncbi:hypothetical protein SFRURICE_012185 [Spodoptera frugiperda]|nr:hypothetical protein SFRURICE_012185 [Spodoptera frugiperda]